MESRCRGRHRICGDITSGVETWDLPVTSPAEGDTDLCGDITTAGGDMGSEDDIAWVYEVGETPP